MFLVGRWWMGCCGWCAWELSIHGWTEHKYKLAGVFIYRERDTKWEIKTGNKLPMTQTMCSLWMGHAKEWVSEWLGMQPKNPITQKMWSLATTIIWKVLVIVVLDTIKYSWRLLHLQFVYPLRATVITRNHSPLVDGALSYFRVLSWTCCYV